MAYATYITEAVVCGSTAHNTSDKSYLLFTESAGMLFASARSVREERSRQRYALQDFSLVRVSLVRGKGGWRVGSVETEANPFLSPLGSRPSRAATVRIVKLLRQFVHGEVPHPELFRDVQDALRELQAGDVDAARIGDVFALRLLHKLGYIAPAPAFVSFLEDAAWLHGDTPLPPEALRAIEVAERASHL
jgi:recombinational DNA repair protein (RecF pathway)